MLLSKRAQQFMIADDSYQVGVKLPDRMTMKEINQAVIQAGNKNRNPIVLIREAELPLHAQ